jgi:hypothetical protein
MLRKDIVLLRLKVFWRAQWLLPHLEATCRSWEADYSRERCRIVA